MATLKQKKAIEHIVNGDSVSKAMTKAGYSPSVAKNPKKLTESITFQQTLEKVGISDEKIAERINEGLDATKAVVMGKESSESFVDVQPDFAIRHKYVETSLKLKGHLQDKVTNNLIVMPILGGSSVPSHDSNPKVTTTQAED